MGATASNIPGDCGRQVAVVPGMVRAMPGVVKAWPSKPGECNVRPPPSSLVPPDHAPQPGPHVGGLRACPPAPGDRNAVAGHQLVLRTVELLEVRVLQEVAGGLPPCRGQLQHAGEEICRHWITVQGRHRLLDGNALLPAQLQHKLLRRIVVDPVQILLLWVAHEAAHEVKLADVVTPRDQGPPGQQLGEDAASGPNVHRRRNGVGGAAAQENLRCSVP
mmetsp:Transcript_22336/g.40137  ORF Transcript_22336/g.40137 Transcript_22336/m.40137 type:complete len:219 (-) Transcript_22336:807-1463(-)